MFYFNTFLAVATFYEVVIDVGVIDCYKGNFQTIETRDLDMYWITLMTTVHFGLRATRSPNRFEEWCSI